MFCPAFARGWAKGLGRGEQSMWRPLSERDGAGSSDFDGPHDGVPEWLERSLWAWVVGQVADEDFATGDMLADEVLLLRMERELQRPILGPDRDMLEALHVFCVVEHRDYLNVVDYLCRRTPAGALATLDTILKEAGSLWTVTDHQHGARLTRRVDQVAQNAADQVLSVDGRASTHLSSAWSAVYGRAPDPTTGYRESVRAVEAMVCGVVEPKNKMATLGTSIGAIRSNGGKWLVNLHDPQEANVSTVVGMLQMLWKGQTDRHGSAHEEAPLNVSMEEAEAALHLAVLLVDWFRRGVVARPE